METSGTRTLTPSRILALALIALAIIALAYLRWGSTPDPLIVPDGAAAGDLSLEPCEYATEDGVRPADCGTLVVPEDRSDPGSRLIALPVTRIRAASDQPGEPIFFLTGGPGQSNMTFDLADRYTDDRDFVMVGYRGIDGSGRLDCPEVTTAMKRSNDWLSEDHFRAAGEAYRSCADRLIEEGFHLPSYGLVQQVEDMEAARRALGYERINLLSESAGTRTAMIYSWRHPESVHRSVMVAVNPPGAFLWEEETTDEQVARYAALCAGDPVCRARTDDLAATMRMSASEMPDRWWFLPIKESNVRFVSFFGLFESTPAGSPLPAPTVFDAWLAATEGDSSGLWFSSVFGDLLFPDLQVWGQYASAAMLDAQAARDYFASGEVGVNLGRAATTTGWGNGVLADSWPPAPDEAAYSRVLESDVETLLVGGSLDVSTPPQVANRQLLPHLPNGHEVVLEGFGHTGTLFMEQPEAGIRMINTFFESGRVDDSLYVPQRVDFTPSTTLGAMARIILGAMLTLAALAVISLAVMARRVRRRGRVGPKSAALLRSLHPLVLGLGGWSLASLVVLATVSGIRIDDLLMVVVSVGVPVGLGIHLAWVDRSWSKRTRGVGLAAATTGALAGAWLGFTVPGGFLGIVTAIITAIVGAAAGANLAVIAVDVLRGRQAGRAREASIPLATEGERVGV